MLKSQILARVVSKIYPYSKSLKAYYLNDTVKLINTNKLTFNNQNLFFFSDNKDNKIPQDKNSFDTKPRKSDTPY
jgi:hypothetical protein